VGEEVGLVVGEDVGLVVGEDVGFVVGEDVGLVVGGTVGFIVGAGVEVEETESWRKSRSQSSVAVRDEKRSLTTPELTREENETEPVKESEVQAQL